LWYKDAGFSGGLYPINPNYSEVHGCKCYPALNDVPEDIDLALIMLPAEAAIAALKETAPGKVKFAFIIASGFSELGNHALEDELVETAKLKGIRIVGPNCMGIFSRKGKTAQAAKQPYGPGPGELTMISQSGGNAANIVRTCTNSGVDMHSSVSIGNQCDLCIEDFIEWYDSDKDVKIISGYVEDFRNGRRFVELTRDVSSRKPVIIWKGGTSERGSQAATSHTGALAISSGIWNGVLKQTGIIPADNLLEIVYLSRALLWDPLPKGPGTCLISPGGAHSVTMTDVSINEGLDVPILSESVRNELSKIIAKLNTIIDNPIDVGAASYRPDTLQKTIEIVSKDKNIHSFIIYQFLYPFKGTGAFELGIELIKAIGEIKKKIDKPIYIALYRPYVNFTEADESKRDLITELNKYKIPYTGDMESCVKMLGRIWKYSSHLQRRGLF
jgi:acetyl-CoA synthetase (ADP-forming)/acetyltransferase